MLVTGWVKVSKDAEIFQDEIFPAKLVGHKLETSQL